MRLDAFIVELLYDHDCVIVPDFGGLIATYRPARLNRQAHIVHPPSKHVSFNKNLTHNDGLLANHMCRSLGIGYNDSINLLQNEVSALRKLLAEGSRIVWDKIGVIFQDDNGQIQFVPGEQENFLLDAYGLKPLQLKPVAAQRTAPVEEKVIALPAANASKNNWWKVAAVAVPVMIAGSLIIASSIKSKGGFDMANLNPFYNEVKVTPYQQPAPSTDNATPAPAANAFESAVEASDEKSEITYDFKTESVDPKGVRVQINTTEKVSAPAAPEKKTADTATERPFEIIGGAFMFEDNAEKFVGQLKAKGFKAHKAGTQRGLFLVAYGAYASAQEAEKALDQIRRNENPNAWVKSK